MNSCVLGIGFILAFANVACTYETTDEVKAELRDAGVIASDASGDDAMKNPVRKGGAKSAVLTRGNNQLMALGNYEWDFADVYTVQFSTTPNGGPLPAGLSPNTTYAEVRWTIAGNDHVRKVSVGNGVTLAGVGEGATIKVYDSTIVAPGDPTLTYTVTATISPGTRGSASNPPIYYPQVTGGTNGNTGAGWLLDPTGAASFVDVPVPQDGGIISVNVIAAGANGHPGDRVLVDVLQFDNTGATISQYSATVNTGFVVLDPACVTVRVANRSDDGASPPVAVKAYGAIAFGVDG